MTLISALGSPIYSDDSAAVLSGGSFVASLPLANIQSRSLSLVARTTNVLTTSTTFDIDLGAARDVGLLAVLLPNVTKSNVPTIRWRGSTVSNFATTVYDSTALQLWPSGLTAEDAQGLNVWTPTLPGSLQTARYWRCNVVDTANVDGYLDFARAVIAGRFVLTPGMSVGAKMGLESETTRVVTDGGAAFYSPKPIRRYWDIPIAELSEADAIGKLWRIQRLLGTHGQVFVVFDEGDVTYMHERSFLGVLRELSPIEYTQAWRHAAVIRIVEEL